LISARPRRNPRWTQISPTNFYSDESGYGFEQDADVSAGGNSITGDRLFYFSAKLPEGNYKVTVTLGGDV